MCIICAGTVFSVQTLNWTVPTEPVGFYTPPTLIDSYFRVRKVTKD